MILFLTTLLACGEKEEQADTSPEEVIEDTSTETSEAEE
tara:strand:+ start:68 stop:184 length:117 start_codon:yes stop_codon:yes gene_type:complete